MFKPSEFKSNLLGAFEIFLFMNSGFNRFSPSRSDMFKSFIWPLLILPLAVYGAIMLMGGDEPIIALALLHTLRMLIVFALSLGLIVVFCKQYERQDFFYKFITISNWFELIFFVLVSPILVLLMSGMSAESLQSYALFITIAAYAYSAYIITQSLRIPWQLGGCLSIGFLLLDQTGFDALIAIKDSLF
ncbi:MAG: hypothetical protein KTR28_08295 [Micavibrio sp.]|nr:hypothetical protein [Micavibrio sp.]